MICADIPKGIEGMWYRANTCPAIDTKWEMGGFAGSSIRTANKGISMAQAMPSALIQVFIIHLHFRGHSFSYNSNGDCTAVTVEPNGNPRDKS